VSADLVRTEEVLPPSASGETRLVVQAAAAIVLGAFCIIGLHAVDGGPSADSRTDRPPSQILLRDAAPAVQRMYGQLEEGVRQAEKARATGQRWPTPETLAAQGVAPFASDPLTQPAYRWQLTQQGTYATYLGTAESDPQSSTAAAFLALIQEVTSGDAGVTASAALDDTRQQLADGTRLHVSVWFRISGGAASPVASTQPAADGWTQIVAATQGS